MTAPVLVVSGDAPEWLSVETLPTLDHGGTCEWCQGSGGEGPFWCGPCDGSGVTNVGRPLRAGDTVTLAFVTRPTSLLAPVPFATATVSEVLPIVDLPSARAGRAACPLARGLAMLWHDAPDVSSSSEVIALPDAEPGHWAIRLTDVKELP